MNETASLATFDTRFRELTVRWNAHQDLRLTQPGFDVLVESRVALDEARLAMSELATAA